MRKPIVAGNWKMNKTADEAVELTKGIEKRLSTSDGVDVVLCPPFTALSAVREAIELSVISLGAQNMHWEEKGAFTGEISPSLLADSGCRYVILGHSERREHFKETDEEVARKLRSALSYDLIPILCVGERLDQREIGETEAVVRREMLSAFEGIKGSDAVKVLIAYEPIWAIGTGRTATPDQANEVHSFTRELFSSLYGPDLSREVRIQYGGSVNPDNISGLMAQPDIDGALVGGASLEADSFSLIVKRAGAAKALRKTGSSPNRGGSQDGTRHSHL